MEIIRTIEEFHKALKENRPITLDSSTPPEVVRYISNYMNGLNERALADAQGYQKENDNYVYDLDSKFNFGKHKGNQLGNVYKCDPLYLEWCMINASGFIISSWALDKMQNEKVFNFNDLNRYIESPNNEEWIINLTTSKINNNGFRYLQDVNEITFFFESKALEANKNKSKEKLTTDELFKGGNWGIRDRNIKSNRMKSIKIKV